MAYKLIFQGKLKSGMSRQGTVKILARLGQMTEAEAESKFFSGKPVVVKRFNRKDAALSFQSKLEKAGLVVSVRAVEPTATAASAPKTAPTKDLGQPSAGPVRQRVAPGTQKPAAPRATAKKPPSPRKIKKGKSLKRILTWTFAIVLVVLLVLVGGAWYLLHRLFDSTVPEQVDRAEAALFSGQTILLGHVNVARLVHLEKLLTGTHPGDYRPNPQGSGLINDLMLNRINPRTDFDQMIFTVNADTGAGVYFSAILLGAFDPDAVKLFLKSNYETTIDRQGAIEVIRFKKQDRRTCEYSPERATVVEKNLILITHPDHIMTACQAFKEGGATVDPQWAAYRSAHLASLGVVRPDQLSGALPSLGGFILQGIQSQIKPVTSVYVGVAGKMVPPGVELKVAVNADDPQWISDTAQLIRQKIDDGMAAAGAGTPLMNTIRQNITIADAAGTLQAGVKIDKTLVAEVRQVFQEGLGSIMQFGGGTAGASEPLQEMVDPEAKPFKARADISALPPFKAGFGQRYGWYEGPLAGKIEAVRITPEGVLEIELHIAGQNIPNAPGSDFGGSGDFKIVSVKDRQGAELLRVEQCGREINSDEVLLKRSFSPGEVNAAKTVRLKAGTTLEDIARIEGHILLNVATQTRTRILAVPLEQDVFKENGFHLRFKKVGGSSVDYVLSGDRTRLLSIRGMNAGQQYLRSASSSSLGSPESTTQSISRQFQGVVQFIELVTAEKMDSVFYNMVIDNPMPLQSEDGVGQRAPASSSYRVTDWHQVVSFGRVFKPKEEQTWFGDPMAESTAGPARLSLFQPEVNRRYDGMHFGAQVRVSMPYLAALDGRPYRTELVVQTIRFDSGRQFADTVHAPCMLTFTGGFKDQSKSEKILRQTLHLRGGISLNIPLGEQSGVSADDRFREMAGQLLFHLPRAVRARSMALPALGERIGTRSFDVQVVEIGAGKIKLALTGDPAYLVDVLVLNAAGEQIAAGPEFAPEMVGGRKSQTSPRNVASLTFRGSPARLRVIIAKKSRTESYPFSLVVE